MIGTTRKMLTPTAMAKMQAGMERKPRSLNDLVKISGLSKPVVTRYIRELQGVPLVHVGDWDKDPRGYPTIAKYKWGAGANVPCPKKHASDAERMRKARADKKGGV